MVIEEELKKFKRELKEELKTELKKDLSASLVSLLEDQLQELKLKILEQEAEICSLKKLIELQVNTFFANNEEIANKAILRLQKKDFVIITDVPETKSGTVDERKAQDAKLVQEVAQSLGCSRSVVTESVTRIGKMNPSKPRLLRFKCVSYESKIDLLKKAKELRKSAKFRNVFVNPDLTYV